ncbi:hypothetical protein GKZ68_15850 [Hymenobacter sp. BRD128]|uniref:hypothetical protein n=1 Tax=Hymenobacter sp. BRD128 TaxID=2675878 RepID=UPI0015648227|nr:hypothetical protein [Hymenobacter sp. BRD128]QKG57962.1 hypothetical protein GKZ68_15850 [Hymenobacter sp. BRD128]
MNPRDLPEVVAALTMETHEVRSELQGINGRIDRLESQMQATREENRENTDHLLEHDDQLRHHARHLNNLEAPQQ